MSTATEMLAKYLAAESALLEGKEVTLENGRRLRMEDLPSIIAGRKEWEQRVAAETARGNKAPAIGGLSMSVASFNATTRSAWRRNG
ncbi:MAG: hypothetical protein H6R10_709 [Rhodocyclaceae bacterium]|nr:hypothetical protein [Rhodocyclaceae bacterium]